MPISKKSSVTWYRTQTGSIATHKLRSGWWKARVLTSHPEVTGVGYGSSQVKAVQAAEQAAMTRIKTLIDDFARQMVAQEINVASIRDYAVSAIARRAL